MTPLRLTHPVRGYRPLPMIRILAGTALAFAMLAAPASAQLYASVTAQVQNGARCTGEPIRQCSVVSGRWMSFTGSEVRLGTTRLPEGTPIRVATAGPGGPVVVGQTTLREFPRWRIAFTPRHAGVVYAAQVLVGTDWLTMLQAQSNVFVDIVSGQLAYGPRLPVTARGTVRWIGRDGRGRAELRRCRFTVRSRCTARSHFIHRVASTRVNRPGTFVFSTRSRRAYGRPLALVYTPRSSRVGGDIIVFNAIRRR